MTLADATTLIRNRRSIKPVDMDPNQPIAPAVLLELIENATWAPNHGLTEPWRFVVFQSEQRQVLSAKMQEVYAATTPTGEFRPDKMEKMGKNPSLAHTVIAACMVRKGGAKIPAVEEMEAVACALQNLMLSASAAGIGSYWSSPPLLDAQSWKDWLKLGEEDRCVGLIYLGHARSGAPVASSQRSPVESAVQYWLP
jgi:nitroreductase